MTYDIEPDFDLLPHALLGTKDQLEKGVEVDALELADAHRRYLDNVYRGRHHTYLHRIQACEPHRGRRL